MTGAIAELTAAGLLRQARRLQGELQVFQGWTPTLNPVPGYKPQHRTVLHVLTNSLPHTGSGYAQRSHSILEAQSQLGWTVHAVTRLGYPVQVGKLVSKNEDEVGGVTYHRLLPARLPAGFDERLQAQAETVLQLAQKLRPAVLHTTTPFVNGIVTRAVAEALGIPWVYEVRGQLVDTWASTRSETAKSSQRYKLFTECEAAVTQSTALVVTLGEAMKQQILKTGGVRRDVLICPNAVGGNFLEEPMDASAARELLGLRRDGVCVGSVSSLVAYEGLDVLIRAVAVLAVDHPHLHCLIVGDGVAAPALRQLARELRVDSRVIFTGRVPREQAHLYHQALDVFVVPRNSLEVTRTVTPLKPVEAMAAARPVVASNLPALHEIVEDSVTGKLVEAENVDALAVALSDLTEDNGRRLTSAAIAMGTAGRKRVLMERTWARNARAIVDAYGNLTLVH
ncbi:glycosyltransferase family 4 protein [Arthrobacter parietis]